VRKIGTVLNCLIFFIKMKIISFNDIFGIECYNRFRGDKYGINVKEITRIFEREIYCK